MREQPMHVKTGSKRMRVFILTVTILTAVLAIAVTAVVFTSLYKPSYKPPPFEQGAVAGMPEAPDSYGYGKIDAMGNFTFWIASVMYRQEDGSIRVYFTNPADNEEFLLCEVVDHEGNTLYKSGLLRPGEHVVSLNPVKKLENEAIKVEVKVYALDSEHFYSAGTVTLDNTLQPY